MIYLADKPPADTVDYVADFLEFVGPEYEIDSVSVTVDAAGFGESPLELIVIEGQTVAVNSPCDATRLTAIQFWLTGGTGGTRYRGTITISDDASADPDRSISRQFEIMVKKV